MLSRETKDIRKATKSYEEIARKQRRTIIAHHPDTLEAEKLLKALHARYNMPCVGGFTKMTQDSDWVLYRQLNQNAREYANSQPVIIEI